MDQYANPYAKMPRQRGNEIVPADRAAVPDAYVYDDNSNPYPYFGAAEEPRPAQGFDIYKYFRIANKYKWSILALTLLGGLIMAVVAYLQTPVYRAAASIQIDRSAIQVTDFKNLQNDESTSGVEFFQTQYQLLQSRSLAEKVAANIGLFDKPDFVQQPASVVSIIKSKIMPPAQDVVEDGPQAKQRRVVDYILERVFVSPVRGSRIVKVSFDHPDPLVAQSLANGYADAFIADSMDRRFEATAFARKFLEERLEQLKAKLEASERQLVTYAEENGLFKLGENKDLATSDLEAINTKLSEARAERVKQELLWKQSQKSDGFGLQEILDSKTIQENRKLRSELAAKYQQKLAVFKPAFPEMVELRNQIKELDRSAEAEVQNIKNAIEATYLAAKEQEEELQRQIESTKTQVSDERSRSIQYNILQREVDTNRQLYDGLLQRYKEIGVTSGVGTNNVSVVDRAVLPKSPEYPRKSLSLVLGLMGGLLSGIGLALLRDFMDDTFKVPEDIERESGLTVMGVIPKLQDGEPVDRVMDDPRSSMSEAIRSLRTGLQLATADGLPKSLLITSSKPSEGKTTSSISLAKSMVELGLNVLLIDGDLRNASLHKRLRVSNSVGLSSFLTGSKTPEECVQSTPYEGLMLMSSGPLPPNPVELLGSARFLSLMAMAADAFDIVIIDGPPVIGLADAPMLSYRTQATIMVVEANSTRRSVFSVALKRLRLARANLLGVVMTKFDVQQTGYGYGYGYGDYDYHSYGTQNQLTHDK